MFSELITSAIKRLAGEFVEDLNFETWIEDYKIHVRISQLKAVPGFFEILEGKLLESGQDIFPHGVEIRSATIEEATVKVPLSNIWESRWEVSATNIHVDVECQDDERRAHFRERCRRRAVDVEMERRRKRRELDQKPKDESRDTEQFNSTKISTSSAVISNILRLTKFPGKPMGDELEEDASVAEKIDQYFKKHLDLKFTNITAAMYLKHDTFKKDEPAPRSFRYDVWRVRINTFEVNIGATSVQWPDWAEDKMQEVPRPTECPEEAEQYQEDITLCLRGVMFKTLRDTFILDFPGKMMELAITKRSYDPQDDPDITSCGFQKVSVKMDDDFKVNVKYDKVGLRWGLLEPLHQIFQGVTDGIPDFLDFLAPHCPPENAILPPPAGYVQKCLDGAVKRIEAQRVPEEPACFDFSCACGEPEQKRDSSNDGDEIVIKLGGKTIDIGGVDGHDLLGGKNDIEKSFNVEQLAAIEEKAWEKSNQKLDPTNLRSAVKNSAPAAQKYGVEELDQRLKLPYRWIIWPYYRYEVVMAIRGKLFVDVEGMKISIAPELKTCMLRPVPGEWKINAHIPELKINLGMMTVGINSILVSYNWGFHPEHHAKINVIIQRIAVALTSSGISPKLRLPLLETILRHRPWEWEIWTYFWREFGIGYRPTPWELMCKIDKIKMVFRVLDTRVPTYFFISTIKVETRRPFKFKDVTGALAVSVGNMKILYGPNSSINIGYFSLMFDCSKTQVAVQVDLGQIEVIIFSMIGRNFAKAAVIQNANAKYIDKIKRMMGPLPAYLNKKLFQVYKRSFCVNVSLCEKHDGINNDKDMNAHVNLFDGKETPAQFEDLDRCINFTIYHSGRIYAIGLGIGTIDISAMVNSKLFTTEKMGGGDTAKKGQYATAKDDDTDACTIKINIKQLTVDLKCGDEFEPFVEPLRIQIAVKVHDMASPRVDLAVFLSTINAVIETGYPGVIAYIAEEFEQTISKPEKYGSELVNEQVSMLALINGLTEVHPSYGYEKDWDVAAAVIQRQVRTWLRRNNPELNKLLASFRSVGYGKRPGSLQNKTGFNLNFLGVVDEFAVRNDLDKDSSPRSPNSLSPPRKTNMGMGSPRLTSKDDGSGSPLGSKDGPNTIRRLISPDQFMGGQGRKSNNPNLRKKGSFLALPDENDSYMHGGLGSHSNDQISQDTSPSIHSSNNKRQLEKRRMTTRAFNKIKKNIKNKKNDGRPGDKDSGEKSVIKKKLKQQEVMPLKSGSGVQRVGNFSYIYIETGLGHPRTTILAPKLESAATDSSLHFSSTSDIEIDYGDNIKKKGPSCRALEGQSVFTPEEETPGMEIFESGEISVNQIYFQFRLKLLQGQYSQRGRLIQRFTLPLSMKCGLWINIESRFLHFGQSDRQDQETKKANDATLMKMALEPDKLQMAIRKKALGTGTEKKKFKNLNIFSKKKIIDTDITDGHAVGESPLTMLSFNLTRKILLTSPSPNEEISGISALCSDSHPIAYFCMRTFINNTQQMYLIRSPLCFFNACDRLLPFSVTFPQTMVTNMGENCALETELLGDVDISQFSPYANELLPGYCASIIPNDRETSGDAMISLQTESLKSPITLTKGVETIRLNFDEIIEREVIIEEIYVHDHLRLLINVVFRAPICFLNQCPLPIKVRYWISSNIDGNKNTMVTTSIIDPGKVFHGYELVADKFNIQLKVSGGKWTKEVPIKRYKDNWREESVFIHLSRTASKSEAILRYKGSICCIGFPAIFQMQRMSIPLCFRNYRGKQLFQLCPNTWIGTMSRNYKIGLIGWEKNNQSRVQRVVEKQQQIRQNTRARAHGVKQRARNAVSNAKTNLAKRRNKAQPVVFTGSGAFNTGVSSEVGSTRDLGLLEPSTSFTDQRKRSVLLDDDEEDSENFSRAQSSVDMSFTAWKPKGRRDDDSSSNSTEDPEREQVFPNLFYADPGLTVEMNLQSDKDVLPLSISIKAIPNYFGSDASITGRIIVVQPKYYIANMTKQRIEFRLAKDENKNKKGTILSQGAWTPVWILDSSNLNEIPELEFTCDGSFWSYPIPLSPELAGRRSLNMGDFIFTVELMKKQAMVTLNIIEEVSFTFSLHSSVFKLLGAGILTDSKEQHVFWIHPNNKSNELFDKFFNKKDENKENAETNKDVMSIPVGWFNPFLINIDPQVEITLKGIPLLYREEEPKSRVAKVNNGMVRFTGMNSREDDTRSMMSGVTVDDDSSSNSTFFDNYFDENDVAAIRDSVTRFTLRLKSAKKYVLVSGQALPDPANFIMVSAKKKGIGSEVIVQLGRIVYENDVIHTNSIGICVFCGNEIPLFASRCPMGYCHSELVWPRVLSAKKKKEAEKKMIHEEKKIDVFSELAAFGERMQSAEILVDLVVAGVHASIIDRERNYEILNAHVGRCVATLRSPNGFNVHALCYFDCQSLIVNSLFSSREVATKVGAPDIQRNILATRGPPGTKLVQGTSEIIQSADEAFHLTSSKILFGHRLEITADDDLVTTLIGFVNKLNERLPKPHEQLIIDEEHADDSSKNHPVYWSQHKWKKRPDMNFPTYIRLDDFVITDLKIYIWANLDFKYIPGVSPHLVRALRIFTLWESSITLKKAVIFIEKKKFHGILAPLHQFLTSLLRVYLFDIGKAIFAVLGSSNLFNAFSWIYKPFYTVQDKLKKEDGTRGRNDLYVNSGGMNDEGYQKTYDDDDKTEMLRPPPCTGILGAEPVCDPVPLPRLLFASHKKRGETRILRHGDIVKELFTVQSTLEKTHPHLLEQIIGFFIFNNEPEYSDIYEKNKSNKIYSKKLNAAVSALHLDRKVCTNLMIITEESVSLIDVKNKKVLNEYTWDKIKAFDRLYNKGDEHWDIILTHIDSTTTICPDVLNFDTNLGISTLHCIGRCLNRKIQQNTRNLI